MTGILWIGPTPAPEAVHACGLGGVTEFRAAAEAVAAVASAPAEVVLVQADADGAAEAIRAMREAAPDAQVLAVTDGGLPAPLASALQAGAAGVIDVAAGPGLLGKRIHEAWLDYMHASGERELLMRLRDLNEEFLRNVIAMEKRNIELTGKIEETARLSEPISLLPGSEGARERVLVVDDEESICDLVSLTLQDGYEIRTSLHGKEAQEILAAEPFHLVITDKNLPGCSGLEIIRAAKAANADTDVILMTGFSSAESAIEALNLGASGYLEKPFELPALRAKVEEVIAKQRDRLQKRHYLQLMQVIKRRNRAFLEQYGSIRTDIEAWLQLRQKQSA